MPEYIRYKEGGEDIISDTDMKEMFALYQRKAQTHASRLPNFQLSLQGLEKD